MLECADVILTTEMSAKTVRAERRHHSPRCREGRQGLELHARPVRTEVENENAPYDSC